MELNGEAFGYCCVNVPEALVLRGKCKDRIPQLDKFTDGFNACERLLYVNPPRTGLENEVSTWITSWYKPERMAYLSCSAGTLSRDLKAITSEGYVVEQILPFDFFPYTIHVECLVLLSRG